MNQGPSGAEEAGFGASVWTLLDRNTLEGLNNGLSSPPRLRRLRRGVTAFKVPSGIADVQA